MYAVHRARLGDAFGLGDPFNPADWPGYTFTDDNGNPIDPQYLQVVTDQMGNKQVVPLAEAGAPTVLDTHAPGPVITWVPEPGTGGLVLRQLINGVETDTVQPSIPFDQMTDAQKLAFWTAQDPASAGDFYDYANADGSAHLTDTGAQAIQILQNAGATDAAQAATTVASGQGGGTNSSIVATGVYAGNDQSLTQTAPAAAPGAGVSTTGLIGQPVAIVPAPGTALTSPASTGSVSAAPGGDASTTDTGTTLAALTSSPLVWVGVGLAALLLFKRGRRT